MTFQEQESRTIKSPRLLFLVSLAAVIVGLVTYGIYHRVARQGQVTAARSAEVDEGQIREFCAICHVFPPPSSLPKDAWHAEIQRGFGRAIKAGLDLESIPPQHVVVQYFEERAPLSLVPPVRPLSEQGGGKLNFVPRVYNAPNLHPLPGVSNVNFVYRPGSLYPDCLVCDMREGWLLLWPHDQPDHRFVPIARLHNPAHAEAVDLDQDGNLDFLVADLGTFVPSNEKCGRVVWLRRDPQSDRYDEVVLAEDLGRVADVQAADFDGDGDYDLVVAVFGFRTNGQVLYLENRTEDYARPDFFPTTLDERTGAIHVPVADLNADGRLDFVVLLSQEHEQVIAYLNEGPSQFRKHLVYAAPGPAYGSNGIQLVDLDHDGDLDVLYTNGDSLDVAFLRSYHSVQWLENEGSFPFRHHHLTSLPGVHRAVAADMDADGDLDVVAVSFLPDRIYPQRERLKLDSIIWLEQLDTGRFERHGIENIRCDHATVEVADVTGDGLPDLVTGNFTFDGLRSPPTLPPMPGWITIWENQPITQTDAQP